jgi:hypothetical protein
VNESFLSQETLQEALQRFLLLRGERNGRSFERKRLEKRRTGEEGTRKSTSTWEGTRIHHHRGTWSWVVLHWMLVVLDVETVFEPRKTRTFGDPWKTEEDTQSGPC